MFDMFDILLMQYAAVVENVNQRRDISVGIGGEIASFVITVHLTQDLSRLRNASR